MIRLLLFASLFFSSLFSFCQAEKESPLPKTDFQIFLKQPAKEIKLLMYEKNFLPIQGKLSEDKKAIIMKDYQDGNKVHVKVLYDDGTEEEFTKSPCFIDPVIS
jgi:hypothetical protein